jgi:uncharacterized protein
VGDPQRFNQFRLERDARGLNEVDVIVEREDGKILALETKLASAVTAKDLSQLKWLRTQLGEDLIDAAVLYTGRHAYRQDGIAIIPFALLGA